MVRFLILLAILSPATGFSYHQLDLTWAAASVHYEGEGEEPRHGAGARFRYTGTNPSTGVGMSVVLVKEDHRRLMSLFVGGGWRWDGDVALGRRCVLGLSRGSLRSFFRDFSNDRPGGWI